MICSNCKRRLRHDATSCLCGKFGAQSQIRQAHIQCCFDGCPEGAIIRMHTKTGWANVCRTHYPQVEREYVRVSSPFMEECRKAWASRNASRIETHISAVLPRQPGEDHEELALGIARDPLEQEFLDRMEP